MTRVFRRWVVVLALCAFALPVRADGISPAATTRIEESGSGVSFSGGWTLLGSAKASGGAYRRSNVASDSVTLSFDGSAVSWIGQRARTAGITRVLVDGVQVADVDAYASRTSYGQLLYGTSGLAPGPHTLTLAITGQRNRRARNTFTYVDAFDVVTTGGAPPPPPPPAADALTRRVLTELHVFTDWLSANRVRGQPASPR